MEDELSSQSAGSGLAASGRRRRSPADRGAGPARVASPIEGGLVLPARAAADGSGLPGLGALIRRLRAARRPLALLLDFDGTLAPIRDRPEDARAEPAALAALAQLSLAHPVAIVSGRGLKDIARLAPIPRSSVFGSHGQEVRLPDGRVLSPFGGDGAELAPIRGRMAALAREFDGTWIEEKPQALVLHYRNLRSLAQAPELRSRVDSLARRFAGLRLMAGRKIFEFVPADAPGKGGALSWHLDRLRRGGGREFLPVYFGDDVTDEGAFAAVAGDGIGVLVARRARPTAAAYRLGGVSEVAAALTLLARAGPQ